MSIRARESVTYVTPETFDNMVVASPIPVLVSFHTPWSKVMVPLRGRLTEAFAGQLRVMHVNVVTHPSLAARFKIRVVPTLLIFKGGVPIEFIVGAVPSRFIFETVLKALSIRMDTQTIRPAKLPRQRERMRGLVHSSTLM